MGWLRRFELPTFGTTTQRSNQLSYSQNLIRSATGVEPVSERRSGYRLYALPLSHLIRNRIRTCTRVTIACALGLFPQPLPSWATLIFTHSGEMLAPPHTTRSYIVSQTVGPDFITNRQPNLYVPDGACWGEFSIGRFPPLCNTIIMISF